MKLYGGLEGKGYYPEKQGKGHWNDPHESREADNSNDAIIPTNKKTSYKSQGFSSFNE
ncbi:MAG: hypothetical protein ACOCP8_02685 [archaeon]